MATHELKCWPEFFAAIVDGRKTFEYRRNDRGFAVGDTLRLMEFEDGGGYTGREVCRRVTYMLEGIAVPWLPPGCCVMSIVASDAPTTTDVPSGPSGSVNGFALLEGRDDG